MWPGEVENHGWEKKEGFHEFEREGTATEQKEAWRGQKNQKKKQTNDTHTTFVTK